MLMGTLGSQSDQPARPEWSGPGALDFPSLADAQVISGCRKPTARCGEGRGGETGRRRVGAQA